MFIKFFHPVRTQYNSMACIIDCKNVIFFGYPSSLRVAVSALARLLADYGFSVGEKKFLTIFVSYRFLYGPYKWLVVLKTFKCSLVISLS